MNALVRFASATIVLASAGWAAAQEACLLPPTAVCGQTYRLVYRTVYEQQQHTAYRVEYETVCEEHPITTYKPVWETAVRENRYTVARPVTETTEREERYTVQRPVYETAERDESYTVMKPVYETAYRTETHTVLRPVTTYRTQYVDQGCYAQQTVLRPALPSTRLTWQRAACTVDPVTGATVYQRPGLYWVQTPRAVAEVQQVWRPNVVAQQIPQTTYVPQTVAQQVPVQVCKYVPEVVVRKVPVQVCRMVTEQRVQRVPVTTCRMVYEERVEKVPYQVCRMVAEQSTVRVPRVVEKRIPVTYTCNVPRLVCYREPLDACGEPLAQAAVVAPAVPTLAAPAAAPPGSCARVARPGSFHAPDHLRATGEVGADPGEAAAQRGDQAEAGTREQQCSAGGRSGKGQRDDPAGDAESAAGQRRHPALRKLSEGYVAPIASDRSCSFARPH